MTLNGTRGFARALIVALSLVTMGFLTPVVAAAPAQALTDVGAILGVETRCDNSPYSLCLYYKGFDTAWWGTNTTGGLGGARFFANTGEGSGQAVIFNAGSVSCDASSTSICYISYNSGHSGPTDWLYGQRMGRLVETYKANAAVRISFGA